ncbi:MAG: hypothetical protein V4712_04475 [Pseudomonadota bacterium]
MTRLILLAALLALAACGADGPPLRPGTNTPGLTLSGDARFGVSS